ncbi:hypothetical protein NDU88_008519 [Pleurodeles waltl]|uniref:Uncharacterized protein n=1 Tax=Pleurodeles waltl TaxID=8319 RepID=A0AAV7P151_PLEWA|nr:hypothetical protein NDU88_008519 [Pleurodeles waltl]
MQCLLGMVELKRNTVTMKSLTIHTPFEFTEVARRDLYYSYCTVEAILHFHGQCFLLLSPVGFIVGLWHWTSEAMVGWNWMGEAQEKKGDLGTGETGVQQEWGPRHDTWVSGLKKTGWE